MQKSLRTWLAYGCFLFMAVAMAQSLERPIIYTTPSERPALLEKVEKYPWAQHIVAQMHGNVDPRLALHREDPLAILDSVPVFRDGSKKKTEQQAAGLASGHFAILKLASEAAMLYYLEQDEAYAQMAADILQVYVDELAPRTPQTTTITGNAFFDPRTTYPHIALTYDFVHPFLKKRNTQVFSTAKGGYLPYNDQKTQKALLNIVGNVLQEYGAPDVHGKVVSNHPILTSPGALFGILCIEDDAERERLFNVFWEKGTAHQNSFKNTILPIYSEQGLWPESLSYGFMPIVSMNLNIIDRIKPELNVTEATKHIFNGNFLYDYLRHPDRRFVTYGDSKRNNDFSANNYRYALDIGLRRGYTDIVEKAKLALNQAYRAKGGYMPSMESSSPYDQYRHLQLFWGVDIPKDLNSEIDFNKKTVVVEHAGVALQRSPAKNNNETYGLCGIIGGAHYVHSHLTGIGMELYGAGYVMAPSAGLPPTVAERQIPLHEHYFRLYAGNNTVVVNGTSHGRDEGSWKRRAHVWQNTVVNSAAEPKHLEDGIAPSFSFATQYLDDTVNDAEQQRTLSTIRTSETTAYYFDIFRSRSNQKNKFHDYIYHNLGDNTQITTLAGTALTLRATNQYDNDIGDVVKSPGWRFFEDTRKTDVTKSGIKIRFHLDYDDRYMHMFVPGGIRRSYVHALAPPTREAKNGYVDKKTQVVTIRQKGEAWKRPYIAILEPSTKKESSVVDVQPLWDGKNQVGAVVKSKTADAEITDIIISNEGPDSHFVDESIGVDFKGRFGIVRTSFNAGKEEVELYIGEGKRLSFGKKVIQADATGKGTLQYHPDGP
ncbi:hypothetical protein [Maribacter sp. 2307ULW6-5]|uniref:hypothetical protein n=1 Tax=Maribacter sp. 2307ULW6-5 TaxID=3386275 RepID=UPI0039BCE350